MNKYESTVLDDPVAQELSERLADVFRTADVSDVLADDVFLDGHPPLWRFQLQGRDAFNDWIKSFMRAEGYVGCAVLRDRQLVGFLLITDVARAKNFYCDVLGLPMRHEDEYAVVVDAGGTPLRLAVVERVPEPVGTNVGWLVDDVNASVRDLVARGIEFERFPGMCASRASADSQSAISTKVSGASATA